MVKRRPRSKSKTNIIHLKRRSAKTRRKSYSHSPFRGVGDFLDKEVSVRSILKYTSITLAFILAFVFVFMLGRLSVDALNQGNPTGDSVHLSSQTKQTEDTSETELGEGLVEDDENDSDSENDIDVVNLSESEDEDDDDREADVIIEGDNEDDEEDEEDSEDLPDCAPKVAEFDYTYRLVDIDVSNFN